jgi:hypothetical protein
METLRMIELSILKFHGCGWYNRAGGAMVILLLPVSDAQEGHMARTCVCAAIPYLNPNTGDIGDANSASRRKPANSSIICGTSK